LATNEVWFMLFTALLLVLCGAKAMPRINFVAHAGQLAQYPQKCPRWTCLGVGSANLDFYAAVIFDGMTRYM
jgi:hypothetical protein